MKGRGAGTYSVCLGADGERCAELVPRGKGGRCPRHGSRQDARYVRRGADVYRSPRWAGVRRTVLRRSRICEACGRELATDADHIIPVDECVDPFDPENVQALCRPCHSRKTLAEIRGRPRD